MSCLSSTRKAEIEARITKLQARLTLAENALDDVLNSEGIKSGKFDSGEAMSWWSQQSPEELQKIISNIEANLDYYRNKLNGTGIVRLNLRRR
jgi:ElaB/YqjD/DUF883 family membrane-anchored ribosome-binding protein